MKKYLYDTTDVINLTVKQLVVKFNMSLSHAYYLKRKYTRSNNNNMDYNQDLSGILRVIINKVKELNEDVQEFKKDQEKINELLNRVSRIEETLSKIVDILEKQQKKRNKQKEPRDENIAKLSNWGYKIASYFYKRLKDYNFSEEIILPTNAEIKNIFLFLKRLYKAKNYPSFEQFRDDYRNKIINAIDGFISDHYNDKEKKFLTFQYFVSKLNYYLIRYGSFSKEFEEFNEALNFSNNNKEGYLC